MYVKYVYHLKRSRLRQCNVAWRGKYVTYFGEKPKRENETTFDSFGNYKATTILPSDLIQSRTTWTSLKYVKNTSKPMSIVSECERKIPELIVDAEFFFVFFFFTILLRSNLLTLNDYTES